MHITIVGTLIIPPLHRGEQCACQSHTGAESSPVGLSPFTSRLSGAGLAILFENSLGLTALTAEKAERFSRHVPTVRCGMPQSARFHSNVFERRALNTVDCER